MKTLKQALTPWALKALAGLVTIGRHFGWDLAHHLVSARRLSHQVIDARYISRLPSETVTLQLPKYQIPGKPIGRYLRGIERWGLEYQTYDAGLLELPGGRFEFPQCATGVHGWYVEDAFIFQNFPPPWALHRYSNLFRARTKELTPGTVLPMLGYKNYYHWLIDVLPRLQLLDHTPWQHRPVYVYEQMPRFALESLAGLPYSFQSLPEGYYRSERLCIPTRLSQIECSSPASLRWLRQNYLRNDPVRQTKGRRILISRKDAGTRLLPHEDVIFERLRPLGFERIIASKMSLQEQVQLFANTEIITGAHGAGFTNIVWMPRGSALVEITSNAHVGHSFWRICNQLGHRHGFVETHVSKKGVDLDVDSYISMVQQAVGDLDDSIGKA